MTVIDRFQSRIMQVLLAPTTVASAALFRVIFGVTMAAGMSRFWLKGWIEDLYVKPEYFFTYWGFDWVQPLPAPFLYAIFALMIAAAIAVALGYRYRLAILTFFILFTYVELLDKTNYLNHYYFVSLAAFLMCWLPLNAGYSLDALRRPEIARQYLPRWVVIVLMVQVGIVYFFGGVAKIKYEWLFEAQPLRIWLSANGSLPVIGGLISQPWIAFVFAWGAMLYDLSITFLLYNRRTRPYGYGVLLVFHVLTAVFFNIGMFPYIMTASTLIFFDGATHRRWMERLVSMIGRLSIKSSVQRAPAVLSSVVWRPKSRVTAVCLTGFFVFQFAMPFRHLLYPGDVTWTEEGFRYSWNIMLIEKAGHVEFNVRDPRSGAEWVEVPEDYLTRQQARMMSTQPDMILQFAKHLGDKYQREGKRVEVRADTYVSLNGHQGSRLIDPSVDLCKQEDGLSGKSWILPQAAMSILATAATP